MVGRTIAHYEITERIGAGGMGEVYRARDTRLNRDVALKLLPETFTRDQQRMARFSREAQLLASLNHANIAAIYGLEDAQGQQALVLELVEGETLAERIERGVVPQEDALKIALQIAQALEVAHEQGVIHRDLKPANIKIRPDGQVKVLDFGLAKAMEEPGESSPDLSQSPTLSLAATRAGIILGTAAYMAPEQARGKRVDRRADIWAFGVVLFEMLTGKQAFEGEDISLTLANVMTKEAEWDSLPRRTPPAIRRLLRRCLDKDPTERLRDIGEARIAIRDFLADPREDEMPAAAGPPPAMSGPRKLGIAASTLVALVIAFVAGASLLQPEPEQRLLRLEATLTGDQPLLGAFGSSLALSPDGQRLAYGIGTFNSQERYIYLRDLDDWEDQPLPATLAGYNPFFSPDGQWIGFVTIDSLKKISVAGGTPLTLCAVDRSRGADWGPDGTIVFAPNPASSLLQVSAAGGEPREVTTLGEGETAHRWPQFLPGGRHVLFTVYSGTDVNAAKIEVVNLDSGERTLVHEGGSYGRHAASGHLLYVNNGTLFAAPFDLGMLALTALPAPVLEEVSTQGQGGAQLDLSDDGTLVYLAGSAPGADPERTLLWGDADGETAELSDRRRPYGGFRLSPDGKRLAVEIRSEANPSDIWIVDLERNTQTRLTFHEGVDAEPVWTPDGLWILFLSDREGTSQLFRKPADGSGEAERLLESAKTQWPTSVSSDGKYLAFAELDPAPDIWILPLEGEGKPEPFVKTGFAEFGAAFSPDGRWIAYQSNESGDFEVYVRPFPGPGGKWQVSTGGGFLPAWSSDGRTLFYGARPGIMKVAVRSSGASFQAANPQVAFPFSGTLLREWDITADGQRFVLLQGEGGTSEEPDQITVRLAFNWFAELRRMLAVK